MNKKYIYVYIYIYFTEYNNLSRRAKTFWTSCNKKDLYVCAYVCIRKEQERD